MRHGKRQRTREMRQHATSDKALMALASSLHHSIFVEECFGTGDLCRYEATVNELERKGYRVTTTVAFNKEE